MKNALALKNELISPHAQRKRSRKGVKTQGDLWKLKTFILVSKISRCEFSVLFCRLYFPPAIIRRQFRLSIRSHFHLYHRSNTDSNIWSSDQSLDQMWILNHSLPANILPTLGLKLNFLWGKGIWDLNYLCSAIHTVIPCFICGTDEQRKQVHF